MQDSDTIVSISTAVGNSGISVIRISGSESFKIAEKIFRGKKKFLSIKTHTVNYGKIINPLTKEVIDEVLLLKMQAPKTYTREDIVEIQCHGGYITVQTLLEIILSQGARLAKPGEFTKRAFLNGRIDLSQAEAVADIIYSKTKKSSAVAIRQLEGLLSEKINQIRDILLDLIAQIEVTFDYPEYDDEHITATKTVLEIKKVIKNIENLLNQFEYGRILREGLSAVIIGKPNVGKSSLLNKLSGIDKAIVTEIAGTTRDIIEEYININGIAVKIIDTAGIRKTEDKIESIGVEKTKKILKQADLILVVFDASVSLSSEDLDIVNMVKKSKDKNILWIINKIDIVNNTNSKERFLSDLTKLNIKDYVEISVLKDIGITELKKKIYKLIMDKNLDTENQILLTNVRHKNLLEEARESLKQAIISYEKGITLDILSIDINKALESLGEVTGETTSEDVIDRIFSKFCIGK